MKTTKAGADDFIANGLAEADMADLPSPAAVGDPTVARVGDDVVFCWPGPDVQIDVTMIKEHSEGITAELAVRLGTRELTWSRLALASTAARGQLIKRLSQQHRALPWGTLVEHACRATARAVREGDPLLEVVPAPRPPGDRNLLEGLTVPLDASTLVYGDGDVGKTWLLALALVATSTGRAVPHLRPTQPGRPAAFLDWENGQDDFEDMLYSLERALDLRVPPGAVFYRQMSRPLVDELPRLRTDFARRGIQDIYLDSLAPASGADPESANAAVGCLTALRAFPGTTRLLSGHVSKTAADQSGGAMRPFGSVFVRNLVRSAWEIRRDEEAPAHDLVFAAYHRKHNRGGRGAPLSFRLAFQDHHLSAIASHDLADAPALLARTSVPFRIDQALKSGFRTAGQLALALEEKRDTIERNLRRMAKADRVVRLSEKHGGKGDEIPWGLKTSKADT